MNQYHEDGGGISQSVEEVAHKAAWAAVKQKYEKKGEKWVRKEKSG
jgi:cation transport regulator ChaB